MTNTKNMAERPLVTFALFAYNQEKYIREAVEGALAQTYSPLEIIISDDCSCDGSFELIENLTKEYIGPHRLVVLRNDANLGLSGHINKVMTLASGDLIVVAAGDDISYPNRVSRLVDQWIENGRESGSIFSRFKTIDGDGNIVGHKSTGHVQIYRLSERNTEIITALAVGTSGCTHAWTRDVFDIFGAMSPRIIHEDITIPLRSILIGSVTYVPEELVLYRVITGTQSRTSFSGYRERIKKMARYWEGRVANYEQFAKDSDRALELKCLAPDDVRWLKRVIDKESEMARLNHRIFSSSFSDRIYALFTSSTEVPIGRKLKLLILAFFPWLYGIKSAR